MTAQKTKDIMKNTLSEIKADLPKTVLMTTIDKNETMRTAGLMLNRIDNIANDNIMVLDNHRPIGMINGKDIINCILEQSDKLDTKISKNVKNKIHLCNGDEIIADIIKIWIKNKICFSIIQIGDNFYPISPKTILNLCIKNKKKINLTEIDKHEIIYTTEENTIKIALTEMIDKNIRRLIIKESSNQFNDRVVMQNLLKSNNIDKFLKFKIKNYKNEPVLKISSNILTIDMLNKINKMKNPCIINKNYIITYFDMMRSLQIDS